MTLHETDLDAAVANGIVTAEQSAALRTFSETRAKERALALGHEERFHFMRSFNDLFFAIGIALLGGGMIFFTAPTPLHSLIGALIIWALAELLIGRMRLVLPGILLACFFVAFVVLASRSIFGLCRRRRRRPAGTRSRNGLSTTAPHTSECQANERLFSRELRRF